MRKFLLMTILSMSLISNAWAHIGDRIFPIFEISDEALSAIDLRDGTIDDWIDVIGATSLTANDFTLELSQGDGSPYDPNDLDYRFWLGWNQSTNHIYVAMERVDDIYVNRYGSSDSRDFPNVPTYHDGSLVFWIDGDHSGGQFDFLSNCCEEEEWKLVDQQQAQAYWAMADTPDDRHVILQHVFNWANLPPWAEGGGGSFGERPTISTLEFYVTPFDHLIWNSPGESQPSELFPGKIIGFRIGLADMDTQPGEFHTVHNLTSESGDSWRFADGFADGVLVGVGGTVPEDTAVESTSWARIKASLRSR